MKTYPYSAPIILNDAIFVQYGGQTGSFSSLQRSAAYLIAEQQMSSYIGTLLLPTAITGTWGYAPRIVTDYGYVSQVGLVNFIGRNGTSTVTLSQDTGCVFVWEDTFGYLDVGCLFGSCNCSGVGIPTQVQVAYTAGLPTGVATQPAMLLALTMAAQISLNEMIFPSMNETTGDVGVQSFSSLDYSEKRVLMKRTAFGSSAKAAKIAQLVDSTIRKARPALVL